MERREGVVLCGLINSLRRGVRVMSMDALMCKKGNLVLNPGGDRKPVE